MCVFYSVRARAYECQCVCVCVCAQFRCFSLVIVFNFYFNRIKFHRFLFFTSLVCLTRNYRHISLFIFIFTNQQNIYIKNYNRASLKCFILQKEVKKTYTIIFSLDHSFIIAEDECIGIAIRILRLISCRIHFRWMRIQVIILGLDALCFFSPLHHR